MDNQNMAPEAKQGSKIKKYIKRYLMYAGIVFAIIIVVAIIDSSNDNKTQNSVADNTESAAQVIEPFNIEVTSQIVKKVDGKYRYFFDIRNRDTKNFEGNVTVELYSGKGQKLGQKTFTATKPLEPGLGSSEYLDINSGPISVFGTENGIGKFTYEVKVNDKTAKQGEGQISTKLEDLSSN